MNILVVDDEPDIRDLVQFKLRKLGHSVAVASNGKQGLESAMENTPDLILLDISMPEMSGLEMCSRLRQDDATNSIPVILMTAKAFAADIERGFEAGTNDYLVKPFSPRELIARIEALPARDSNE